MHHEARMPPTEPPVYRFIFQIFSGRVVVNSRLPHRPDVPLVIAVCVGDPYLAGVAGVAFRHEYSQCSPFFNDSLLLLRIVSAHRWGMRLAGGVDYQCNQLRALAATRGVYLPLRWTSSSRLSLRFSQFGGAPRGHLPRLFLPGVKILKTSGLAPGSRKHISGSDG